MQKVKPLLFFWLFLITISPSFGQSLNQQFQNAIDSIYLAHPDAVGIMAHIEAPDHQISWSGAAGYADRKTKEKIESDQPALIASSIKTYVAATILRLVELKKLQINQPINSLLTEATRQLFIKDGYDLEAIQIIHLLSHTSGIEDYISEKNVESYLKFAEENKRYRWTRDEQLQRTVKLGDPIGKAGSSFNYADANYLLLTEIIEGITKKPFYTAMRELLRYDQLGFHDTWFPTLEPKNWFTKELVHQYNEHDWDSYDLDPSWDLYGGGGIATTTEELAQFSYHFFNGHIVKDTTIRDLIFTYIKTKETEQYPYYLGLSRDQYHDLVAYGHGGYWGTVVLYFPELNAAISVYILNRKERALRRTVLDQVSKILKEALLVLAKNE